MPMVFWSFIRKKSKSKARVDSVQEFLNYHPNKAQSGD